MLHQESQHWPTTGSEWFPSSPYPLDFEDALSVKQPPHVIAVEAYNLDDTYTHAVWVAFEILREGGDPILLALLNAIRELAPYG